MSRDLVIPIYVDTNALLDLLASIEGGFSVLEKVTSRSLKSSATSVGGELDAGSEFGIPNVLNLLKLNIGLSSNRERTNEAQEQREAERYHTYGSLFFRLREYLENKKLIKRVSQDESSWQDIQPSDFIEAHGLLRPNPLINSLEIMNRLIEIFEIATKSSSSIPPQTPTGGSKNQQKQQKVTVDPQVAQMEQVRSIVNGILKDIRQEQTRTFVVDLDEYPAAKAVAVIFLDYLRDKTLSEVNNKEYYLLGKVVRKINTGDNATIDLLQGTGMSGMGDQFITQMVSSFSAMPNMGFPTIETKISGPALEIVPIAIFV
jgi:hypothetical protein